MSCLIPLMIFNQPSPLIIFPSQVLRKKKNEIVDITCTIRKVASEDEKKKTIKKIETLCSVFYGKCRQQNEQEQYQNQSKRAIK